MFETVKCGRGDEKERKKESIYSSSTAMRQHADEKKPETSRIPKCHKRSIMHATILYVYHASFKSKMVGEKKS